MTSAFIRGSVLDERIIGGENTTIDKYPAIVSLRRDDNEHLCGGSLLDNVTVVTAAHCLVETELDRAVYGTSYLSKGGTIHKFAAIEKHPHYKTDRYWNNGIAIIKLQTPVTLLQGATFTKLRSTPIIDNEPCTVIGWGREIRSPFKESFLPDQLKRANTLAHTEEFCIATRGNTIQPGNICAADANYEPGRGFKSDAFCGGDSGGPLNYEDRLTGIVSWGFFTCGYDLPDVYAEIRFYKSWIEETMEQLRKIP